MFKEVGKAGADKGELALGKNGDVYALSWDYPHGKKGINVWWRKTNVKEKDVTELFTGDREVVTSFKENKPFLRLYRSEAEAKKEQGRKKRKRSRADAELNVWVGEVRSGLNVGVEGDSKKNPNRFGVKFKDFSYDYTTRVIREMVDKTSIKNQPKPKPKPKPETPSIAIAPKRIGIKMF